MQISDILKMVRPEDKPGAGPIAPSMKLEDIRDRLGALAAAMGLVGLSEEELAEAVASAAEDHEEVMLAARRLAGAQTELAARAGAAAPTLLDLADLGVAVTQAEAAFRGVQAIAHLGAALLLQDLTARIDLVDEAAEAEGAAAAPGERRRLEVIFQGEDSIRLRGQRAAEGRRARTEVRQALIGRRLGAERRQAQALRTLHRLREIGLPAPRERE